MRIHYELTDPRKIKVIKKRAAQKIAAVIGNIDILMDIDIPLHHMDTVVEKMNCQVEQVVAKLLTKEHTTKW